MTDAEIIKVDVEKYGKALNNLIGVDSAYFNGDKDVDAIVEVITLAKKYENIINRQKTAIERFKEGMYFERERVDNIPNLLLRVKSETIEEFVERLKEELEVAFDEPIFDTIIGKIIESTIDRLIKEMIGDK